jgi:hypothetical protein
MLKLVKVIRDVLMDNGHRMVVKMALNVPRVAKIIYYNVSAKYEHMLALYLVEKHRTTTGI